MTAFNSFEILGKKKPAVPMELLPMLSNYLFHGNVRELQVMVRDAFSQHKSDKLSLDVFKRFVGVTGETSSKRETKQIPIEDKTIAFPGELPTLEQTEELLIKEALIRTGNNQTLAARMLGSRAKPFMGSSKRWRRGELVLIAHE
jgi:transcriptional regulator with GAF, ATPase, and Fis domain